MTVKEEDGNSHVELIVPLKTFKARLTEQIELGQEMRKRELNNQNDLDELKIDYSFWFDYNCEVLKTSFSDPLNKDYNSFKNLTRMASFKAAFSGKKEDPVTEVRLDIGSHVNALKKVLNKADLYHNNSEDSKRIEKADDIDKSKIFIVHGHDHKIRDQVELFVRKLDLEPIIISAQPKEGMTIIEAIEKYSNVGYGIVLYTPDDLGCVKGEEANLKQRARQNVIMEHGYLMGKLTRKHVAALVSGDIETPSDIDGVLYIGMANNWQQEILRELINLDYEIDSKKMV